MGSRIIQAGVLGESCSNGIKLQPLKRGDGYCHSHLTFTPSMINAVSIFFPLPEKTPAPSQAKALQPCLVSACLLLPSPGPSPILRQNIEPKVGEHDQQPR
ncbi:hypothetical protein DVH24_003344 [Malus domestica]|uniref:Uncharacterized protein n=1 Tax=Malus domestica TaxID=3750 RepID=A0A498IHJ3_MALDO|nr:hypothetical protein DVH24_003344 [Malus domestica]